jgi:hypothetical protein
MHTFISPNIRLTPIVLGVFLTLLPMGAQTADEAAQKHVATLKKAQSARSDYIAGVTDAVRNEKVDTNWAMQKENEIRNSYAAQNLPSGSLKTVECHSSKCVLELELPTSDDPKDIIEGDLAVDRWMASAQKCGYTIAKGIDEQKGPSSVRIIVNCGK